MKKRIITLIAVVAVIAVLLSSCADPYSKDLSGIFGFDFGMTEEDIIEYERRTYGSKTYYTEQLNHAVRYDFVQPFENDKEHVHMYFFDNETGLLISVRYTARSSGGHWHVQDLTAALLQRVGKCDEKYNDGSLCYTYGNIGGVNCVVTYDGIGESFFVDMKSE